jgi:hypothetical protein
MAQRMVRGTPAFKRKIVDPVRSGCVFLTKLSADSA